jgi:hypothetical protein
MQQRPNALDLKKIKVYPLAQRHSLSALDSMLVRPDANPAPCSQQIQQAIAGCAAQIRRARERNGSVMLIYGAHLIKNGAMEIVISLIEQGWVTHLATNGAGTIHDWELSYFGRTEESVRANVADGNFGMWDETGRCIHLALSRGALEGEGFGRSLGRFIAENGVVLPTKKSLEDAVRAEPGHPLAPARAELLQMMLAHNLPEGRISIDHPHKTTSIVGRAFELNVPLTAHPGIGYDIISNHPMFNGAVLGRAGQIDFQVFGGSVERLDAGVVLSVGSAIMGPQVFEKSLSCVNNLRLQSGRPIVRDHSIYVVDLQDGGNWDWSKGEPPKANPAYYLRFCKSFARMGGAMRYLQCDNVAFLHNLLFSLRDHS